MPVISQAIQKGRKNWRAGQLGECHDPWQQPDLAPENRNRHGTRPVATKGRRVDGDRQHLVGPKNLGRHRRYIKPARPWLDIRPAAQPPHRAGIDEVPETALDGGQPGCVLVLPPS